MSTSKRVLIKPTSTIVTNTLHNIIPTRSLTQSYTTNTFSLQSTAVISSPIPPILPALNKDHRVTIVAVLSCCGLIFLITTVLILIVCCIGRKIKSRNLKKYSNFPKEERIYVEKETEYISEENSKYNPIYVSGDSIRGREDLFDIDTQAIQLEELHSIRPGREVEATQDYFQPGREGDLPVFYKGDRLLVREVEGNSQRDPALKWIRGEIEDRDVCFPSYVVRFVDTFEDTFDTFTTPVRVIRGVSQLESLTAQDSAVSVDSAPAELESLFHDVDYTLAPHSNVIPLLSREVLKQRHSIHSDIPYYKAIKRPIRRPPMPPIAQAIPHVPSKLNRPKLTSKKRGIKDTSELIFVPPPLSSSTPVKHKSPTKQTKFVRPFMPRRQRRPDTPNAKLRQEYKLTPPIRKSDVPSWIEPMDSVDAPIRPEPPYTPSTLSLLLFAGSQDSLPVKPPPPKLYEVSEPKLGKAS